MTKRPINRISDLLRELEDPQKLEAFRTKREQEIEASRASQDAEGPLVEALAGVGVNVRSVWDLVNTPESYPAAIPVLIAHLQRDYPARVLEGIARALAVPYARAAWPVILEMFRASIDQTTFGVKAALGVTLSALADETRVPELIALVSDRSHGENRLPILGALSRSRSPEAMLALERAREDPDLTREVSFLLRKTRRRH